MTAKELITELSKLNPDIRIMTCGYEGGYCDFQIIGEKIKPKKVALNVNNKWYYGPHDNAKSHPECPNIVEAYVI